MRLSACVVVVALNVVSALSLMGQAGAPDTNAAEPTLRVQSRAVLVDVLVTDEKGRPVKGLKQDAFTVLEKGKPQAINFFEEHAGAPQAVASIPKMPLDVFTNFSASPMPPAVNLLLLDSLNTHMENQSYVHKQALAFLKTAKPGSRMAIFTMSLGLHFVQGFTDDPALLVAALNSKKANEVETSVMIKGQDETNAEANVVGMMSAAAPGSGGGTVASAAMIESLQNFLRENNDSRTLDRVLLTLANLQRLATFLQGFPGRKNVIWFSESFPLTIANIVDPQLKSELGKTLAMLASARVAIYPVDAGGVATNSFYQAETNLPGSVSRPYQIIGVDSAPNGSGGRSGPGAQIAGIQAEDQTRNSNQYTMDSIAHETGGRAFLNTNGLGQVIGEVTSSSENFYTLAYSPTNPKMDGTYREITVKIDGGKYNLSYRRGYMATDAAVPGASERMRSIAVRRLASENPGAVDPLLPFMDLGMPQSQQILYKILVKPLTIKVDAASGTNATPLAKGMESRYSVDFAIDLNDLQLKLDDKGMHNGTLNVSLLVYDRYGHIASRKDHRVVLNVKPDVYKLFQQGGVQLHAEIEAPKGLYWLRTGVYSADTGKVGTMEIPLEQVKPLDVAAK